MCASSASGWAMMWTPTCWTRSPWTTAVRAPTSVRARQIDEEVSAFYSKVKTPVLSDLTWTFGDIVVDQVYPQKIPDLFAGSQLILVGRYREGGPAEITLTGMVNGERRSYIYQDVSFRKAGGDELHPPALGHARCGILSDANTLAW